ncbi:MAG: DUF3306 domain-containing protein [Rhizobiales bacterium]|nr:DUF3306 domain-containing protein [Hyphomicrobiales bacterium]
MARDERGEADDDGRFLDRWARRKAASDTAPTEADAAPEPEPIPVEEIVARLPPLDSVVPGADVSAFMAAGVPAELRTAALDRLWRIDPAIRDRIADAIDYAEDYNAPDAIPGFGPATREAVEAVARRLAGLDPPAQDTPAATTFREAGTAAAPPAVADPLPPEPEADRGAEPTEPARIARRHGGALPTDAA